jgi:phytoene dehydrogenase-like protein
MGPLARVPGHPATLARFGALAALPATALARAFATPQATALFAGVAAHACTPLSRPLSSAAGVALICAGHRHGWPVAEGGSRAIADALAAVVLAHGGTILTGHRVTSLAGLPPADVVMLDVVPGAAADLLGPRLAPRVRRAYRRYRHGPGAFKIDLAVVGGIPWANAACRRAGTVHAIGPARELVEAERQVGRGRMPARPFVLVSQQSLADPSRRRGDVHPISAYAHVPHGYGGDATGAMLAQIERFAPGFRGRVEALSVTSTADFATTNANLVGGDILGGAGTLRQLLTRPRPARDPYATGVEGVFLCSAATPPGAGAHGMCGYHAARAALAG